jgi:hypothetical protein
MSNRARRIVGVGSSGAARDDVEHQSQHRHSDGDCSNRQQVCVSKTSSVVIA